MTSSDSYPPGIDLPAASSPQRIPVPIPGRPYEVVVGADLLDELCVHVAPPPYARRAALVTCAPVGVRYAARVRQALEAAGLAVELITVPDGEEAKSLDVLASLYHRLAAIPLGRNDVVVALGGGVVGDLAGFAAATWNRGVALVQVPTTLLAQVDAAIGGKTAVNLPEGKNLVGAFHQPIGVVADTATLASLPTRERRAGLGEVAKYGFIADPAVLELLESCPDEAVAGDTVLLTEIVRRGVTVKARVVGADERESGERALLNYGHTVGHAIEALTGYRTYRHGEAVALGMVFAARLGERLGVTEPGLADRTVTLLRGVGLPTGGLRLDPARVWDLLARDKKARGGVRFVLCRRPGVAMVVDQPDPRLVDETLRSLA
ncbi:MAG: 3-dehydroquinate synthase [Egibacteraceae bacterium]